MNDIEKQIEGVNDEEGVDMNRLNSNNNDSNNSNFFILSLLYCSLRRSVSKASAANTSS